jgi:predicted Zn-dependent peptidase
VVSSPARLNRYGVGVEYLTNYFTNLDNINRTSINAAIKKYFDPTNLKILVYAPKAKAEATLQKLGKVEVRDYKEFLQ